MTLRWVPGWNGLTEPEAVSYVAAVEAADGQELEFGVARAINDFVLGCKTDGIWDAIKACNILAGARTLNGALVPLVKQPADSAPARFGTEGGWNYNRETGLQGNGTNNYINSGRNNNADPQDSKHCSLWVTSAGAVNSSYLGAGITDIGTTAHFNSSTSGFFIINTGAYVGGDALSGGQNATGLVAASRSSVTNVSTIYGASTKSYLQTSSTPYNGTINIFGRGYSNAVNSPTNARLAFYSIGESLDLAKLDTRVSALITAIGAAIP